jgi:hypothetical protein
LAGALVRCEPCGTELPAADLPTEGLQRLEGASDPADMAAVVTFRCPNCEAGDVLVLAYGPNASGEEADVLAALSDRPAADDGERRVT